MTTTVTTTVTTEFGPAEITVTERGVGRPILLLHGGAGPASVAGFAELLAESARVLTPTHPGFDGTARPAAVTGIRRLAEVYRALLNELDLHDVLVVGNSIGGWTAAELGLLADPRVTGLVLVDAVGLADDEHPIVDFFALDLAEVADLSYREPDRFRIDVAALPPEAQARMAGNRAALLAYGGPTMADETLRDRLRGIAVPTLVVWGAADRIVEPAHGRTYADRIPGATLMVIEEAGHLPQLETPQRLVADVLAFAERTAGLPR